MKRPKHAGPAQPLELTPVTLPDHRLVVVRPGPDAVLTTSAEAAIGEWIEGWRDSARLEAASIPRPGPLLLHGPPGTGKTTVTQAIARLFEGVRPVFVIDAMRVVSSHLGETSASIAQAADAARRASPTPVLVFEEIDTLASHRAYDSAAAVEGARATTTIMRLLEHPGPSILTTNRLDVIDPAIVRRCEYVVAMPEPTPEARRAIVAAVLGEDPGALAISLVVAVPLARRARRRAFLEHRSGAEVFAELLGESRSA